MVEACGVDDMPKRKWDDSGYCVVRPGQDWRYDHCEKYERNDPYHWHCKWFKDSYNRRCIWRDYMKEIFND
jgi:hypothetical protein